MKLKKDDMRKLNGKPKTHGLSKSNIYWRWNCMIQRCQNQNNSSFYLYGARGITVCRRWQTFENFIADMGFPPRGHTLERLNNSKGYSPGNCIWADKFTQARNKRTTLFVRIFGQKMSIIEAARGFGVDYGKLKYRIKTGMGAERAIFEP